MSQSFSLTPRGLKHVTVKNTETLPASGNTQLIEINLHSAVEKVSFQVDNVDQALDAFIVEGRVHQDASYFTIASVAGDFSTPAARVFNVSGAPVSLAAGASARFDLDTSGLFSVKVSASAAVDDAVVTIYASGAAGGTSLPNITLTAGDIEIGAVELKDAATDVRASIVAANTARTTGTVVVATQPIDASGNVLGRTAANTARTTATLVDPVQMVNADGSPAGAGYSSQPTVTRPANTTAYTAGDVVGATAAAITFARIGPANGQIIITDVDYRVDLTAVPSGMTSFRLHLYNATPPSALADNAPWDLPSGDRASYLGYIDLGTPVDVGSTLYVQTSGVNKKLAMGATTSLFGYLVTNGAYTPASAGTQAPRLNAVGV